MGNRWSFVPESSRLENADRQAKRLAFRSRVRGGRINYKYDLFGQSTITKHYALDLFLVVNIL